MNYIEIGAIAEEVATATRLPVRVASVYLNCTRWEIKFADVDVEGRQLSAVINIDSSNRDIVHSEIKRQLLAKNN
jgi:hypothetical protein